MTHSGRETDDLSLTPAVTCLTLSTAGWVFLFCAYVAIAQVLPFVFQAIFIF